MEKLTRWRFNVGSTSRVEWGSCWDNTGRISCTSISINKERRRSNGDNLPKSWLILLDPTLAQLSGAGINGKGKGLGRIVWGKRRVAEGWTPRLNSYLSTGSALVSILGGSQPIGSHSSRLRLGNVRQAPHKTRMCWSSAGRKPSRCLSRNVTSDLNLPPGQAGKTRDV